MDLYFFDRNEYGRLYNCNLYQIGDIPLASRQHIPISACLLLLYFILTFLYLLCLWVIRQHLETSCYKIIFYMGLNDIFGLAISGLMTGIFGFHGTVFCSFPDLIYLAGMFGAALWYNETLSAILLAMNRCIEIANPHFGHKYFGGKKTCLWLLGPFFYSIFGGFSFKPPLYSGNLFSWFYNPHVGYIDDFGGAAIYSNNMELFNAILVVTVFPATYSIFLLILLCKHSSLFAFTSATLSQKKIFFQVLLISCFNISSCIIMIYMQFFRINQLIIYVGSFGWFLTHGIKPVVYLSMNKTIQHGVLKMVSLRGTTAVGPQKM